MTTAYIGAVHHEGDSAWGIVFPDLPGCFSAADEFADLPAAAAEAVALHLEGLAEDGVAPPTPGSLDAVRAHIDAAGAVSFLPVPAPDPERCIRVNVSLPEALVQRIDARVGPRGRSAFLAEGARQALAQQA
jgi:predicted RNase H-like HicB family nuclease